MNFRTVSGLIIFIVLAQTAVGKVDLPAIIADNMVLQQRAEIPLWGKAAPDRKVTVVTSWNERQYSTRSDASGNWKVAIHTPEAGGPYAITFDDGGKLTIANILIGEVWVCAGQSNMEISMRGYVNQPILHSNEVLMKANNSKLRLFHIERNVSNTPLADCEGAWQVSSPAHAATFSAVGFQFAMKLQQLLGVPVGIIEAAWGGTPIEAWMTKSSLLPFPSVIVPTEENNIKPNSDTATCLYNAMINPIAGYGIKGFIWYQGENNRTHPSMYKDLMAAMVKGWRQEWETDSLSFYYVQIAPYDYKGRLQDSVPLLREAQAEASKIIPHSGMVVSMDVGNKKTIHPPDKTTIAKRLLYWALGDTYGWEGIAYQSPAFQDMKVQQGAVTVSFFHATRGLTAFDQKIEGFELAGKDQVFYPARAKIKGRGKVVLQSDKVPRPVAVRYLFKDWIEGNLYNTAGLPAGPFRTDHW